MAYFWENGGWVIVFYVYYEYYRNRNNCRLMILFPFPFINLLCGNSKAIFNDKKEIRNILTLKACDLLEKGGHDRIWTFRSLWPKLVPTTLPLPRKRHSPIMENSAPSPSGPTHKPSSDFISDKADFRENLQPEKNAVTTLLLFLLFVGYAYLIWTAPESVEKEKTKVEQKEEGPSQEERLMNAAKEKPLLAGGVLFISLVLPVILFLFALIIYLLHWQEERSFYPPPTELAPRWSIVDAVRIVVFFFTLQVVVALVFRHIDFGIERSRLGLVVGMFNFLAIFTFILVLVIRWNGNSIRELGFHTENLKEGIWKGSLGYFIVTPLILLSLFLLGFLAKYYEIEMPQHPIQSTARPGDFGWFLFLTTIACVVAPLAEETFFRGFLYPLLRNYIGKFAGMVVVSAFFAILHGVHVFLPIFILGMFLVYLYEKTGSLIPSIVVHGIHNGFQMGKLFLTQMLLSG